MPQGPIALIHKGIRALVLETEALERGRAGLAPAISGMLCSGVRQEDIPPPPAKQSKKQVEDLDGCLVAYRDSQGLEKRVQDAMMCFRLVPEGRLRDLGLVPQIGSIDGEDVKRRLFQIMQDEADREGPQHSARLWTSLRWWQNIREAPVMRGSTSFARFVVGDFRKTEPADLDIRSFRAEGTFPVGGGVIAEAPFRGKMAGALLGFEYAMRGLGGEDFNDITREQRDKLSDLSGASWGCSEAMMWWKFQSAVAEFFHLARYVPGVEIRREYEGLPPADVGRPELARGPKVWASLLRRLLEAVDVTDSPLGGEREARFMAKQWKSIDFGRAKVVTPENKKGLADLGHKGDQGGKGGQGPKGEQGSRGGQGKASGGQVCMRYLRGVLDMKTKEGGAYRCEGGPGGKPCSRWHPIKGKAGHSEVLNGLFLDGLASNSKEVVDLRALVRTAFRKD